MNKPVLVVMAAGMGSRYGGMKQIDPVGPNGQVIVDYSLYDARRAGFETVIFVIKHEIEDAFKAAIGDRVSKAMNVKYAFQQLDELPAGYTVPEGRVKPWGTCHAVLAAKDLIDGPFAVINADDYYGPGGVPGDVRLPVHPRGRQLLRLLHGELPAPQHGVGERQRGPRRVRDQPGRHPAQRDRAHPHRTLCRRCALHRGRRRKLDRPAG